MQWGAVALGLRRRTLNRENPGSNHLAAVSKRWQFHSPHVATVHTAWLLTHVDMCTNSLRAESTAHLIVFQRNRTVVNNFGGG